MFYALLLSQLLQSLKSNFQMPSHDIESYCDFMEVYLNEIEINDI